MISLNFQQIEKFPQKFIIGWNCRIMNVVWENLLVVKDGEIGKGEYGMEETGESFRGNLKVLEIWKFLKTRKN